MCLNSNPIFHSQASVNTRSNPSLPLETVFVNEGGRSIVRFVCTVEEGAGGVHGVREGYGEYVHFSVPAKRD